VSWRERVEAFATLHQEVRELAAQSGLPTMYPFRPLPLLLTLPARFPPGPCQVNVWKSPEGN
jgi:hypothetical protein